MTICEARADILGDNSMDFTNLTSVSEQLFISGITSPPSADISTFYNGFSYTAGYYEPYPGIDVDFPGLKSAMKIGLCGNISRFDSPLNST